MADSVKIKLTGDDKEFRSTLSGVGQTANSVFKGLMASQIVTKGISLLANGLKSAINTGMQFEAAMSQVAAISGATGAELELLTETAKRYGETTMFSASQAAEALNYMALAGWDAQQSVDALGGVLDLAAASGMDLGAASDAVTDYLSAFSMEASQAGYMADLMAYAQSKSNTTAAMLADAYGNCASSMHAAGQDIETTTAMLMALANQGIKGSEAGTQMSAVMRDLTSKMENGKIMIGKTAVTVADSAGNFRDLNDIITDVGKATEGMGTAEQSAAIMETFTARSVKAIQTILNEGVQNVNDYEAALRGSEGTAAEQAEKMMDNLQGDIKIFQSALEGVHITASESTNGVARSLVQEATGILESINKAGKIGGIGGMFDAAIAQIPTLLPKAVKGVQGLLSGLGKRLPGLVKNLFATIPDMLGSIGDLVPSLIESLTGAAEAAVEGVIANLPDIATSLVIGLGKAIASAATNTAALTANVLSDLLGPKQTQYKGLELPGELTYAVDTQANVDNAGAEADVTAAWQEFVVLLEGYGLTTEQVAKLLAFKGTQAELDAYIEQNFPNLDEAAKAAIKAKFTLSEDGKSLADLFGEGGTVGLTAEDLAGIIVNTDLTTESIEGYLSDNFPDLDTAAKTAITTALTQNGGIGASLVSELTGLGIKPADIVKILTAQAEGSTDTVESLLEGEYAGVKEVAITAITNAWNNSPASFDTSGASVGFGAQLLVEMFTNGKKEDDAAVDAALATAKETIDKKRQELIDYINNGGEDSEGAQNALNLLDEYDKALTDYATNYANASTDICREAGKGLTDLAKQCQDAVDSITQSSQRLLSLQEILFQQGKAGAKLNDEDLGGALFYILTEYQQAQQQAQEAKEAALLAGQSVEEANAAYEEALAEALSNSRKNIADLLKGQTEGVEGLDVGAALTSIWDQVEAAFAQNGQVKQSEIEQMLRDAGYDNDLIARAVETIFGEQQYSNTVSTLGGLDFGEDINSLLASAISERGQLSAGEVAALLQHEGYGEDVISDVIGQLFQAEDMNLENLDLAKIIGSMDFGSLGELVKTAVEAGLIEGVDSTEGIDINQLILQLIGESTQGGPEPEVDTTVGVNVETGEITTDEDTPEKVTEAVEEASEGSDATANPKLTVEPEVEAADGTDSKVVEAAEQAVEGTEEQAAQTVNANVDLGLTIGNVTVNGNNDVAGAVAAQLSGQSAEVTVDVKANVGSVAIEGGGAVNTAARQIVSDAVTAAQGQTSSASSVGRNFTSGLASGILAGRSAVIAAAISVANAAAAAARAALQIHSPSKVTEGFGRMFDQGFVVGIDREASSVVRSAVNLVNNVVGAANLAPKMDLSGMQSALNGAMTDFTDAEAQRDIVLRLNGRDVARVTATDNNKALNHYSKQVALGYGRG